MSDYWKKQLFLCSTKPSNYNFTHSTNSSCRWVFQPCIVFIQCWMSNVLKANEKKRESAEWVNEWCLERVKRRRNVESLIFPLQLLITELFFLCNFSRNKHNNENLLHYRMNNEPHFKMTWLFCHCHTKDCM